MSVGDPATVFNVHRGLLERSPYLKRCFDGSIEETDDRKTALKEESPEAFGEVLRWMYRGRLPNPQNEETTDMSLINVYILADKLCMEELKNSIITMLCHFYVDAFMTTTSGLTLLAEKGLDTCELRSFLLWQLSRDMAELGYAVVLQHAPDLKEFVDAGGEDVVQLFEETTGCKVDDLEELDMDGKDKCRWHEHRMTPVCAGAKTYENITSKKRGTKRSEAQKNSLGLCQA